MRITIKGEPSKISNLIYSYKLIISIMCMLSLETKMVSIAYNARVNVRTSNFLGDITHYPFSVY